MQRWRTCMEINGYVRCDKETHGGTGTARTHLVLMDLGDPGAERQLVPLPQRVEEPARRRLGDGHLPDADVPAGAGLAHAAPQRAADHLVAEADAEDPLAHAVQRPHQEAQPQDPQLVGVRVVGAAADHEPVVGLKLTGARELAVDGPVQVPRLAGVAEGRYEDVEVPAVLVEHVLRVVRRHQQRVPPARRGRGRRRHRCLRNRNHGWFINNNRSRSLVEQAETEAAIVSQISSASLSLANKLDLKMCMCGVCRSWREMQINL